MKQAKKRKRNEYEEWHIRRLALGLAVQLPDDKKAAYKVIEELRTIYESLLHRGNGRNKSEDRVLS